MILCDAGPLFALFDESQHDTQVKCRKTLAKLTLPLTTTWPCFAEAMYLSYKKGGWPSQKSIWRLFMGKVIEFYNLSEIDISQMQFLMEQYKNVPMDLADASLVVAAEALNITRIFTLDSDFFIYQIGGTKPFEVIPLN